MHRRLDPHLGDLKKWKMGYRGITESSAIHLFIQHECPPNSVYPPSFSFWRVRDHEVADKAGRETHVRCHTFAWEVLSGECELVVPHKLDQLLLELASEWDNWVLKKDFFQSNSYLEAYTQRRVKKF